MKSIMKIPFGVMCLAIWYKSSIALEILRGKSNDPFSSEPSAEFEMYSIHWITLICGVGLIIVGIAELIKWILKNEFCRTK